MASRTTCRGGNYVSPIALCGAPKVPNGVRQAPLQLIGRLSACELVSLIKCPHLLSRSVESPAKTSAEEWGKKGGEYRDEKKVSFSAAPSANAN